MKNALHRISLSVFILLLAGTSLWWYLSESPETQVGESESVVSLRIPGTERMSEVERKEGRADYFFNLMRDPATAEIPGDIRTRELEYAKKLPVHRQGGFRTMRGQASQSSVSLTWNMLGPDELGGRTRALGIDRRNPDIIIAGGVSGGIWKSTDGGTTWQLKTDPNQNMSVAFLTQDPNNPDTWYYSSGEFLGNSASDRGFTAPYFGTGIYRSDDNGVSWSLIPSTEDKDVDDSNSRFDFISRIKISPVTGSIFAASNAFGILRSTDGGTTFPVLRGGSSQHQWADLDIDSDGNIIAVFSSTNFNNNTSGSPGVFYSQDDGDSWTDITPSSFPGEHDRSVITFAPSDSSVAYVFTEKVNDDTDQSVAFHKIDIDTATPDSSTAEERSSNLPDFGDPVGGVNLQGGYNMLVSVKPDDPDFVMIGATNLFRSTDGFATPPSDGSNSEKDKFWIGGYAKANDVSQYPNQHPDQHVLAFDPTDPNRLWAGHDGALSLTTDLTATSVSWSDKDEGYVTGQFYTVAIPLESGDNRILGGTQDNGTPFFEFDSQNMQSATPFDISSGDGSYGHIGPNAIYASSQRGRVLRWNSSFSELNFVNPRNASNKLFIHPFVVDPNDENTMFYPGGIMMWRNTTLDEINNPSDGRGTTEGWDSFTATPSGFVITTLAMSTSPAGVLYYGASSGNAEPKIFRIDNATSSSDTIDISIPEAPGGAYVHNIAVNPNNADEAIVVMSNYNIVGLYHTSDGGDNWTAIEGNLEGDAGNPGPSLRDAAIFPTGSGAIYFVATSTGVFSTDMLEGSSTTWTRESAGGSASSIGFSVAEFITSRVSDGKIAVGTHGRGIYLGQAEVTGEDPNDTTPPADPTDLKAEPVSDDIQLSWQPNSESDLAKYRIYRGRDIGSLVLIDSVSSFSTSFLDTDDDFINYFYRITAVDVNDNESGFSNAAGVLQGHLTVDQDWKLIGNPLKTASGADLPSTTELIAFDGAYEVTTSLDPKRGFWIKTASEDSIRFQDAAFTDVVITLDTGWNLISGIADTIATSDISDPDGILSNTPVFEFDGTQYVEASNLKPGVGYWINAGQQGDIRLAVDAPPSKRAPLAASDVAENADILVFSRQEMEQHLLVTGEELSRSQKMRYLLPPRAPATVLDVRTSDQFRIIDSPKQEISITADDYPVEVRLKEGNSADSYRLTGIRQGEKAFHDLKPGESKLITGEFDKIMVEKLSENEKPLTFDLLPNYPNPFNPTTNIEYQLASKEFVSLEVYDVLGRRIQVLVNQIQEPGIHTVTFEASALTSGTYFIRMKAGDFKSIQQMMLIK